MTRSLRSTFTALAAVALLVVAATGCGSPSARSSPPNAFAAWCKINVGQSRQSALATMPSSPEGDKVSAAYYAKLAQDGFSQTGDSHVEWDVDGQVLLATFDASGMAVSLQAYAEPITRKGGGFYVSSRVACARIRSTSTALLANIPGFHDREQAQKLSVRECQRISTGFVTFNARTVKLAASSKRGDAVSLTAYKSVANAASDQARLLSTLVANHRGSKLSAELGASSSAWDHLSTAMLSGGKSGDVDAAIASVNRTSKISDRSC
jgi:hypothetical protein